MQQNQKSVHFFPPQSYPLQKSKQRWSSLRKINASNTMNSSIEIRHSSTTSSQIWKKWTKLSAQRRKATELAVTSLCEVPFITSVLPKVHSSDQYGIENCSTLCFPWNIFLRLDFPHILTSRSVAHDQYWRAATNQTWYSGDLDRRKVFPHNKPSKCKSKCAAKTTHQAKFHTLRLHNTKMKTFWLLTRVSILHRSVSA